MFVFRGCATAAATLLVAGCGYFNAMYNAERRFRDAQSAAAKGDEATAHAAYVDAIEKAAKSYRSRPRGRWADDALFLIGRARFSIGEYEAARAAMAHLLERSTSRGLRAGAFAYRGAAEIALGDAPSGAASLDSAAALEVSDAARPFFHLWRARAAFDAGDAARAWQELDAATVLPGPLGLDARFEAARRALSTGDSTRTRSALAALLADPAAALRADSVETMAGAAATRWGAAFAYSAVEPSARARWPLGARNRFALARAELAAQAADTSAALSEALRLAEVADDALGQEARYRAARWRLANISEPDSVAHVRALLAPAFGHAEARTLLRVIQTMDVLLERGAGGEEPLALFAAAELARDSLRAPALARQLFLSFAEAGAESPWIGKALLAALNLSDEDAAAALRHRLGKHPTDVYLRAVSGETDAGAFTAAEERLGRSLATLHFDAAREAESRATGVAVARARLDTLQGIALADSLAQGCALLLDSLALGGIRADSVRAACLRSDSARVTAFLEIDTLSLAQPRTRADSLRRRQRAGVDTTLLLLP